MSYFFEKSGPGFRRKILPQDIKVKGYMVSAEIKGPGIKGIYCVVKESNGYVRGSDNGSVGEKIILSDTD